MLTAPGLPGPPGAPVPPGSAELPQVLAPLAFLLGTWQGEGVGGYQGMAGFRYGQELTFSCDGRPALAYTSRTWWLDEPRDGRVVGSLLATEAGFWRMASDGGEDRVEVMLAHPFGIAEIYVGRVTGTRVDLDSNVLVRTSTARAVERSARLYGIVEDGDLAYAVDMAAGGKPMQSHLSARLRRAPSARTDPPIPPVNGPAEATDG